LREVLEFLFITVSDPMGWFNLEVHINFIFSTDNLKFFVDFDRMGTGGSLPGGKAAGAWSWQLSPI